MSKTYTEEEVLAMLDTIWGWEYPDQSYREKESWKANALAELTKPSIHPDVPVLFRDTSGINVSRACFTGEGYPTRTNIRPLVPIDVAVDKAYRIIIQTSASTEAVRKFLHMLNKWRDHYLETGEM